jgi:phenylacetic acid degradation operon negative regulatory protein
MARVDYADILDLFCWGMDKLTRPTLRNLLAGYEEYAHRRQSTQVLLRLEQAMLIRRSGKKSATTFCITAKGWERAQVCNPEHNWNHPWDDAWRVVVFDVPEARRKERKLLWQALRSRNLGLLQRSVWIWPHDLTRILHEIVQVKGLPENFCGFTAPELFLCTHAEVVATAWNWEEIARRHQTYLTHLTANRATLQKATTPAALAGVARLERQAFDFAFSLDPLLPRALLPDGYLGRETWKRHMKFRNLLGTRLGSLTTR